MDYETYFGDRLAQLRMKAGVSARDMSLSMGQSQGYINKLLQKLQKLSEKQLSAVETTIDAMLND